VKLEKFLKDVEIQVLTARSPKNNDCYAWMVTSKDGPFYCKNCGAPVMLKKGAIRQHHFAHIPPQICSFGLGESEIHYKAKREIYCSLKDNPACFFCELEYKIDCFIPDIFAIINTYRVAIEIQKSNLSIEYVSKKTRYYSLKGINTIWIIPELKIIKSVPKIGSDVVRPSQLQIFFNILNFGKLYIWSGMNELINVFHLSRFYKYIPEDYHYNEYGEEIWHGGYNKSSKIYRNLVQYPYGSLKLSSDFNPCSRSEFLVRGWNIPIPSCLIWMDNLGSWWKER